MTLADTTFLDVLYWMIVFFFWVMIFWIFITVVADLFRRDDISGWKKAGWLVLIIFLPLIGILMYVIFRPKMTEQDRRMMEEYQTRQRRAAGYSPAEELAKLTELRNQGAITEAEYEDLKRKAMG